MDKMKRLAGKKILLVAVALLCIWFCKGAGHTGGEEYTNLNLRQSPGNCIG